LDLRHGASAGSTTYDAFLFLLLSADHSFWMIYFTSF
jgi:hypothetical protein